MVWNFSIMKPWIHQPLGLSQANSIWGVLPCIFITSHRWLCCIYELTSRELICETVGIIIRILFSTVGTFASLLFESVHETLTEHPSSPGIRPWKHVHDIFCYCHLKNMFLSKVTETCTVIIGLVLSYKPKTRSKYTPSFFPRMCLCYLSSFDVRNKNVTRRLNSPCKVKLRSFPNLWVTNWTAGLLVSLWWVKSPQQRSYLSRWPALGLPIYFFF